MAKRATNGLTTARLKDLARRGAEVALKELRAEIAAIERTFPELGLPASRRALGRSMERQLVGHAGCQRRRAELFLGG